MLHDLENAEQRIDRDKRARERELEALLLLLLLQARRYAVSAVRLGADPFAAMAGVLMGSTVMGLPGGSNRLAALLMAAEYDGYRRTERLIPSGSYLYTSRANYQSVAAQTLANYLASLGRNVGQAIATAGTTVVGRVRAIRQAFRDSKFIKTSAKVPWRVSSIASLLIARAYNTGYRTGLFRPDLPPFWLRYKAVIDNLTTVYCRTYHDTTLPSDHPWWATHWPPTHGPPETGTCRAVVVPVFGRVAATEVPPQKPTPQYGYGLFPLGILRRMNRTIIIGGPNTGKTTLADRVAAERGVPVQHTDDLIPLGWSESSAAAAKWIDNPAGGVIEGVAAVRALRKWLKANPNKPLPAEVVFLTHEFEKNTVAQAAMTKGVRKVWDEIEKDIRRRGAKVMQGSSSNLALILLAIAASRQSEESETAGRLPA